MSAALIGHTSFVGRNLDAQAHVFDLRLDETHLEELAGKKLELLVCATDPVEPEALERLTRALRGVTADRLVLLSSIEVYTRPEMVDEDGPVDPGPRSILEKLCRERAATTILRLPTPFGPGLQGNVLADLMSGGRVYDHHPESVFQYYPLAHLWRDLHIALDRQIPILNLACEPIPTRELASTLFGRELPEIPHDEEPAVQDVRSKHAGLWGGAPFGYLYGKERILGELKDFVERERA